MSLTVPHAHGVAERPGSARRGVSQAAFATMVGRAQRRADRPAFVQQLRRRRRASHERWDRSFLKALYSMSQKSRFQRSEMARSIVRDFMKE
jgi:hypothetical protein